jgi:uncharacterized membrane protein
MVHERLRGTYLGVALLILIAFTTALQSGQGQDINREDVHRLILSIYMDRTGNALVTGYTEDPMGLSFLNSSQYTYDNKTNQLYATTNALTRKEGGTWALKFESLGSYEDYHLAFILPNDFMIKNISSTQGVNYLLSASNDSIAVDFHGYDINDPAAEIEYEQPLEVGVIRTSGASNFLPILVILAIGFALVILWLSKARLDRNAKQDENALFLSKKENSMLLDTGQKSSTPTEKMPNERNEVMQELNDEQIPDEYVDSGLEYEDELIKEPSTRPTSSPVVEIEISKEMAAVIGTLIPRERAVLQALIERGGRSTQADLRYETRMPKSTLTSIIYSLERRKLVTKKEWGRTNMIELSDWFLSKKNGS